MNVQIIHPDMLKPHPDNPKDHPVEQIEALARTIDKLGFDQPVVVDQHMTIIKGHGRWLAAKHLGMTGIPVIVRDVTEADAVLNMVLDNRLNSREYDQQALREDLLELKDLGALELSLFTEADISLSPDVSATADLSLFSLATTHKCPSCQYRW